MAAISQAGTLTIRMDTSYSLPPLTARDFSSTSVGWWRSHDGVVAQVHALKQVGVLLVHGDGAVIVHGDVQLGAGEHVPLAGDDQLPDSLNGLGGAGGTVASFRGDTSTKPSARPP